ncbi:MAG: META domain-containing protein [Paramuribaculum sp.]|nr:META domain-containing protein [Paramuribaculum sp.]
MNKILTSGCALLLIASLAGCSALTQKKTVNTTQTNSETRTTTQKQKIPAVDKVLFGEWTALTVGDQTVTGDERPYVIFDTTSTNPYLVKVYANNGCNTLNGSVVITPGGEMKKTATFPTTMRLCPNAPYELGVNMALETVSTYKMEKIGDDYELSMYNPEGYKLMTLGKSGISFLNGAWTVTKVGNETIKEDVGMQLVIDIPEEKIHGNGGCNVINGKIFIDPSKKNSIQFTNLITTMMYCPNLQLEQALLVALEQVETAVTENNGKTATLKDASGKPIISLKRLNLK